MKPGEFIVGLVFALPAIATVIAAPRWSRLGDRIGYALLLAGGLLGAGILVLPQSLVQSVGWLVLLRFL